MQVLQSNSYSRAALPCQSVLLAGRIHYSTPAHPQRLSQTVTTSAQVYLSSSSGGSSRCSNAGSSGSSHRPGPARTRRRGWSAGTAAAAHSVGHSQGRDEELQSVQRELQGVLLPKHVAVIM